MPRGTRDAYVLYVTPVWQIHVTRNNFGYYGGHYPFDLSSRQLATDSTSGLLHVVAETMGKEDSGRLDTFGRETNVHVSS